MGEFSFIKELAFRVLLENVPVAAQPVISDIYKVGDKLTSIEDESALR